MGSLLNETGDLLTPNMEEAEVPNDFFASVFTGKTGFQEAWSQRAGGRVGTRKMRTRSENT